MKTMESVLANTYPDRHGERMSPEGLDVMVKTIKDSYIPVGIEHDPRQPPVGRMKSAYIRDLEDGEKEVVAIMEFFDEEESPNNDDKREIVISRQDGDELYISYDRNYRDSEDQRIISEIAVLFGKEPIQEIKKSLDPISILTIGGIFVLGEIAKGVLEKVGSDAWDIFKGKLKELTTKRKPEENEKLLVFKFLVESTDYFIEVEIIFTNPSNKDIELFLKDGLRILDKVLPLYFDRHTGIRRLVFEFRNSELELSFAVRKDCLPLKPTLKISEIIKTMDNRDNDG